MVLTPTRELAEQVHNFLKEFTNKKIIAVYGGVSINPQIEQLRTANIVVGTPGRILDHIDRKTIDLSKIKILVLDEADRMLDMGFVDEVTNIMKECPEQRQTLLFSATLSNDIKRLEHKFMKDPVRIEVQDQVDPNKLSQEYYDVRPRDKMKLLINLLKAEVNTSMVFCNTRMMVDQVTKNLQKNGLEAVAIHGGFTQAKRNTKMKEFKKNKSILVCSDVAARGLDIPSVSHVFNYDIPSDPKDYIHRIGRTARAGKEGKAINILAPRDHDNMSKLLMEFPKLKIKRTDMPRLDDVIIVEKKRKDRNNRYGSPGNNSRNSNRPRNNNPGNYGRRNRRR